jgi:hypothetical protein
VAAQRHLGDLVAARFALDTRLDAQGLESAAPDPNSGGFIAFAAPELLVSPLTDLFLSAWIKIPVLNLLDGWHEEPLVAGLAAAYDF